MNTNLLGVAFMILTTNFFRQEISAIPCNVCTNAHHWMEIQISRVANEMRVPVMVDGKQSTRLLESTPVTEVRLTNYVTDPIAAQRRGRVPPIPMEKPAGVVP